ncbi:lysine N(6)-hydroxylase/L-ornithine N(5)-oxygenase family protein [Methylovulum psychrotolerans]|uniref:Alcaligin biosynthesis protein n=1 Tax=Methylovulum psychrotolerans TaxID=1704499 RepID=A0A2S5CJI1_9GAMM|nr:SidA/IucD/PvdA family monooxygenase [Methylovulum psychrotolerans]POZ50959.1 alcaligin biosynthesis protein [Methylovulum psychrotolerans]
MPEKIYDVVGIGIGPFNLSLACLLQPIKGVDSVFLDSSAGFNWHPGMMLESAHLQTPFLSDLVTLADPTSPFSFLNYLKEQGRIYAFYIRENFFLLRSEYNQYCQWAAAKLDNVVFNSHVWQVDYHAGLGCYLIHSQCTQTGQSRTYRAKALVLGTGTVPYTPPCCANLAAAVHSSQYLNVKADLQRQTSITVLGSGQSAAEIYYDLLQDIDKYGYELSWITRSARFFPLEYNKLTLEMTSPEYVDYFHGLPAGQRDRVIAGQHNLYKGINGALINDIYDLLYAKSLNHAIRANLLTHSALTAAAFDTTSGQFTLDFEHQEQAASFRHHSAGLVLATGYHYRLPEFLAGIEQRIQWDGQGRFAVNRNYSIDPNGNELFVQNVGLHSHGFTTPDLGMVCYRNACIIEAITGTAHYPIERRIAFQQFTVPEATGI